jgi:hypothetical protein
LVVSVCREQRVAAQLSGATEVASAANPVNYVEVDGHAVAYETGAGGGPADVCKLSPGTVYCFSLVEGVKAGDPWAEAIILGAPGVAKGVAVVVAKTGAKPGAKAVVGNAQAAASGAKRLFCKVFCKEAAKAGPRLAQDIAVSPAAPRALATSRSIGRASHDAALQADIASLPAGARNVRVNQQQVNALGQRVGINRPDLQYTLNGRRYYVEYEGTGNPRGAAHRARIIANDPGAVFLLRIVP